MNKTELFKLNVPRLREEALKIENIVGVHGMDKPTLIQVLADHHGIDIEDRKKKMYDTAPIKKEAAKLRAKRLEASQAGDQRTARTLRKKAKNLKRKTRAQA